MNSSQPGAPLRQSAASAYLPISHHHCLNIRTLPTECANIHDDFVQQITALSGPGRPAARRTRRLRLVRSLTETARGTGRPCSWLGRSWAGIREGQVLRRAGLDRRGASRIPGCAGNGSHGRRWSAVRNDRGMNRRVPHDSCGYKYEEPRLSRKESSMPRLKQILFPIDFSRPCARIAGEVEAVAEHFTAGLTLLHAAYVPVLPAYPGRDYSAVRREIREVSTKLVARFAARHFPSYDLNCVVEEGDSAQVIINYARRHKIDLIMMPTHGYGPFRRFLTGSVTGKVLHDALCPVWTSAHSERVRPRGGDYRNILCAVDCNSDAVALVRWAVWIGNAYGATIKLVHVIPALNETSRNRGESALRRYLVGRAEAEFEAIMDHAGFRKELLLRGGNIPARLADTVRQQHADLLIVGRGRVRKALGRLRTHSLAIVRESPCPVISI
jgi:nucleotide-binding universal stress UspA family protein